MPRGTQADSEWLCMSRGINLVELSCRESGATGDSTPGSCALDKASRYRSDSACLVGGGQPIQPRILICSEISKASSTSTLR